METTAVRTENAQAFNLNREKLWWHERHVAELLVVMACAPVEGRGGRLAAGRSPRSCVETIGRRGGRAALRVHGAEGDRERVDPIHRRAGAARERPLEGGQRPQARPHNRSTPDASRCPRPRWRGQRCLQIARTVAAERVQWGSARRKHDAVAQMLGSMAASTFAMEAISELCSLLADRHDYDIRLEAAIAKLYTTPRRGGASSTTRCRSRRRGYETARRWPRGASRDPCRAHHAGLPHQPDLSRARARSCTCSSHARRWTGT